MVARAIMARLCQTARLITDAQGLDARQSTLFRVSYFRASKIDSQLVCDVFNTVGSKSILRCSMHLEGKTTIG
jgi:hypothetical protein